MKKNRYSNRDGLNPNSKNAACDNGLSSNSNEYELYPDVSNNNYSYYRGNGKIGTSTFNGRRYSETNFDPEYERDLFPNPDGYPKNNNGDGYYSPQHISNRMSNLELSQRGQKGKNDVEPREKCHSPLFMSKSNAPDGSMLNSMSMAPYTSPNPLRPLTRLANDGDCYQEATSTSKRSSVHSPLTSAPSSACSSMNSTFDYDEKLSRRNYEESYRQSGYHRSYNYDNKESKASGLVENAYSDDSQEPSRKNSYSRSSESLVRSRTSLDSPHYSSSGYHSGSSLRYGGTPGGLETYNAPAIAINNGKYNNYVSEGDTSEFPQQAISRSYDNHSGYSEFTVQNAYGMERYPMSSHKRGDEYSMNQYTRSNSMHNMYWADPMNHVSPPLCPSSAHEEEYFYNDPSQVCVTPIARREVAYPYPLSRSSCFMSADGSASRLSYSPDLQASDAGGPPEYSRTYLTTAGPATMNTNYSTNFYSYSQRQNRTYTPEVTGRSRLGSVNSTPYEGGGDGMRNSRSNSGLTGGQVDFVDCDYKTSNAKEGDRNTKSFASVCSEEINEYNVDTVVKEIMNEALKCKKSGDIEKERSILQSATQRVTKRSELWNELIRLETDVGDYTEARRIVKKALEYLPEDEELLEKGLRIEDRFGSILGVLCIINSLINIRKYRCIKTVVDSCMVLAKLGAVSRTEEVFQFLISNDLCKQGNLIVNYVQFYYRSIDYKKAMRLMEQLIPSYPKHGPLWFLFFVTTEHIVMNEWNMKDLKRRVLHPDLQRCYNNVMKNISNELIWKVYYFATQMLLRTIVHLRLVTLLHCDVYSEYRESVSIALHDSYCYIRRCLPLCPPNLKWKILLLMGRVESFSCRRRYAKMCFQRCIMVAPPRSAHSVYFEISRLIDFMGEWSVSKAVIDSSFESNSTEWKLALERIHQHMRDGEIEKALVLNEATILSNKGAGRLWASLIQIMHQYRGPYFAYAVFSQALQFVAKSGEVWCEGGRIFLNPSSSLFSPHNAKRCLNLAVYFTPQYGDSFIETIRLAMLLSEEFLRFHHTESTLLLYYILQGMNFDSIISRCQYYDPNYGTCWFKVKAYPLCSAKEVMIRAIKYIAWELTWHSEKYYTALLDYARKKNGMSHHRENQQCHYYDGNNDRHHLCQVFERMEDPNAMNRIMQNTWKDVSLKKVNTLSNYTFAFPPDQMQPLPQGMSIQKKVMLLFGTSQIEA